MSASSVNPVYGALALTSSGRMVDLLDPDPASIDLRNDIAPALALIPRFNGAAGAWYVSDHLTVGASLITRDSSDPLCGLYFLLHDAHEAYLGDITTPAARAIAMHADRGFDEPEGEAGDHVMAGLARAKVVLDRAIHGALGVAWPPPPAIAAQVRKYDLRMMVTEANHLTQGGAKALGRIANIMPLKTPGALKSTGRTPAKRAENYISIFELLAAQCRGLDQAAAQ